MTSVQAGAIHSSKIVITDFLYIIKFILPVADMEQCGETRDMSQIQLQQERKDHSFMSINFSTQGGPQIKYQNFAQNYDAVGKLRISRSMLQKHTRSEHI